MSINIHFRSVLHPLSWRLVHSHGLLLIVSHSCFAFPDHFLFEMLATSFSIMGCCGCCCCCCVCPLLFIVTLGAGLRVASLSKCTRSPLSFLETTRSMHSLCIVVCAMIANDPVCQNYIPWSKALCSRTPMCSILVVFPSRHTRCFLWDCFVIMRHLFFQVISKRICWCYKDWLTGFIFLFASWNKSFFQNGLIIPWGSSVKYLIFPRVRDRYVIHQFWIDCNPTRMSLNSL